MLAGSMAESGRFEVITAKNLPRADVRWDGYNQERPRQVSIRCSWLRHAEFNSLESFQMPWRQNLGSSLKRSRGRGPIRQPPNSCLGLGNLR